MIYNTIDYCGQNYSKLTWNVTIVVGRIPKLDTGTCFQMVMWCSGQYFFSYPTIFTILILLVYYKITSMQQHKDLSPHINRHINQNANS